MKKNNNPSKLATTKIICLMIFSTKHEIDNMFERLIKQNFTSKKRGLEWFSTENKHLDGRTPYQYILSQKKKRFLDGHRKLIKKIRSDHAN